MNNFYHQPITAQRPAIAHAPDPSTTGNTILHIFENLAILAAGILLTFVTDGVSDAVAFGLEAALDGTEAAGETGEALGQTAKALAENSNGLSKVGTTANEALDTNPEEIAAVKNTSNVSTFKTLTKRAVQFVEKAQPKKFRYKALAGVMKSVGNFGVFEGVSYTTEIAENGKYQFNWTSFWLNLALSASGLGVIAKEIAKPVVKFFSDAGPVIKAIQSRVTNEMAFGLKKDEALEIVDLLKTTNKQLISAGTTLEKQKLAGEIVTLIKDLNKVSEFDFGKQGGSLLSQGGLATSKTLNTLLKYGSKSKTIHELFFGHARDIEQYARDFKFSSRIDRIFAYGERIGHGLDWIIMRTVPPYSIFLAFRAIYRIGLKEAENGRVVDLFVKEIERVAPEAERNAAALALNYEQRRDFSKRLSNALFKKYLIIHKGYLEGRYFKYAENALKGNYRDYFKSVAKYANAKNSGELSGTRTLRLYRNNIVDGFTKTLYRDLGMKGNGKLRDLINGIGVTDRGVIDELNVHTDVYPQQSLVLDEYNEPLLISNTSRTLKTQLSRAQIKNRTDGVSFFDEYYAISLRRQILLEQRSEIISYKNSLKIKIREAKTDTKIHRFANNLKNFKVRKFLIKKLGTKKPLLTNLLAKERLFAFPLSSWIVGISVFFNNPNLDLVVASDAKNDIEKLHILSGDGTGQTDLEIVNVIIYFDQEETQGKPPVYQFNLNWGSIRPFIYAGLTGKAGEYYKENIEWGPEFTDLIKGSAGIFQYQRLHSLIGVVAAARWLYFDYTSVVDFVGHTTKGGIKDGVIGKNSFGEFVGKAALWGALKNFGPTKFFAGAFSDLATGKWEKAELAFGRRARTGGKYYTIGSRNLTYNKGTYNTNEVRFGYQKNKLKAFRYYSRKRRY